MTEDGSQPAAAPPPQLRRQFGVAVVGAILAFGVDDRSVVVLGLRVRSLGLIVLAGAALAALWATSRWLYSRRVVPSAGTGGGNRAEAVHSIGGLIAVAIGVGSVLVTTIVVVTTAGLDPSSTVALATAAFGVISAVVGAFIGIKIGTDQTGKAVKDVRAAATMVAATTAQLTDQQRDAVQKNVADAKRLTGDP